jgi:hypothetical protein
LKLLGIISVGFDVKEKPTIRISAFFGYWREMGVQ